MKKRVLAWVLLVGFVLLLLNIVLFHVYQVQSIAVYAVIAIWFVFSDKTAMSRKAKISDEIINRMNEAAATPEEVQDSTDTTDISGTSDNLDFIDTTDTTDSSDNK